MIIPTEGKKNKMYGLRGENNTQGLIHLARISHQLRHEAGQIAMDSRRRRKLVDGVLKYVVHHFHYALHN